jgi:hypothetical protein
MNKTTQRRLSFTFSPETEQLIRKIAKDTDLKLCAVIKRAVELLNKELYKNDK